MKDDTNPVEKEEGEVVEQEELDEAKVYLITVMPQNGYFISHFKKSHHIKSCKNMKWIMIQLLMKESHYHLLL